MKIIMMVILIGIGVGAAAEFVGPLAMAGLAGLAAFYYYYHYCYYYCYYYDYYYRCD